MSDSPLQAGYQPWRSLQLLVNINEEIGTNCIACTQQKTLNKVDEIMSSQQDFISNLSNRDTFIDMCRNLSMEYLGPNAFKDQETAMDKGMKSPHDKKLHDTIEQYATINKNMKFLGEEGKSFTMRELNKQIKKMLTP
jgi:hypothetical protein